MNGYFGDEGELPLLLEEEEADYTPSVEDVDEKLRSLAARAPAYSFDSRDTVRNRYIRTSRPREELEAKLKREMEGQLMEYDREFRVRKIDQQWLRVREQRHFLATVERRKRGRSASSSAHSSPEESPHRRLRKVIYQEEDFEADAHQQDEPEDDAPNGY